MGNNTFWAQKLDKENFELYKVFMCELFQIFSNIYFGIEYLKKSDKKKFGTMSSLHVWFPVVQWQDVHKDFSVQFSVAKYFNVSILLLGTKNTHFITTKCDITRMLIKKE